MSVPSKHSVVRYTGSMLGLALLYVLLILLVRVWLQPLQPGLWKYVLAVVPALPVAFGWPVFSRFIKSMDEMYRKIAGDALQTTFGITAVVTFAYGWLQFEGAPAVSFTLIFPFMMAVYMIVLGLGVWRMAR